MGTTLQTTLKSNSTRVGFLKPLAGAVFAALVSISYAQAASLQNVLQSPTVEFLQKRWETLKLKGDISASPDMEFSNSGFIRGDLGYKFNVEPALNTGFHQRLDSYYFGATLGGAEIIQVGVKGSLQVTFSRVYNTKNEALFRAPVPLREFPSNSQEALAKMKAGDAVRLEFTTSQFAGPGFLTSLLPSHLSIKSQYERGAHFFVEIYRLKNDEFRLRLISTHNTGSVSGGVTLKPYIDFGILDNILNGILSCKPFEYIGKKGVGVLPLDTVAVDYVLDLNNAPSRDVFDKVFADIMTLDIQRQLITLNNPNDFQGGLWKTLFALEDHYAKQATLPEEEKSIRRTFKSRMLSDQARTDVNSACFKLWKVQGQEAHSVSSVRTFDKDNYIGDFLYTRTENQREKSFIRSRLNSEGRRDFEMLYLAYRTDPNNAASVRLLALSDFVLSSFHEERKVTAAEFYEYLRDFTYQYARYSPVINHEALLKLISTQRDIRLRTRLVINPHIISSIPVKSVATYTQLVWQYVQGHPVPNMIPTTLNYTNLITRNRALDYDVKRIAQGLEKAFNPATSIDEFYQSLRQLRKIKMFQFIAPGLLISLIPADKLDVGLQFSYSLEFDRNTVYHFESAKQRTTELFETVSTILSALNSRTFDLATQVEAKRPLVEITTLPEAPTVGTPSGLTAQ